MDLNLIVALAVATFIVLVLAEVPVGIALGVAGVLGMVVLDEGTRSAEAVLATTPFSVAASFSLVVIPLFSLMGALIANSGIGESIFRGASLLVGRLPGGLPATTVVATSFFSGVSGSSAADVAAFGRISVSEMRRHGYRPEYAAAVVAAAGTFAVLIPPSLVLILYGITAGIPVGHMLIAGVVPGALSCAVLAMFVVAQSTLGLPGPRHERRPRRRRATIPAATGAPVEAAPAESVVAKATAKDLVGIGYAVVIFAVVIGGLYGGFFTSTEAAAMGAVVALVIAAVASAPYRRRAPRRIASLLTVSLRETVEVTSMVFLLLIGAGIFNYFLASARVPVQLAEWIVDLPVDPSVVVIGILLMFIPLGMFLDGLSTMLMVVPIVAPIVADMGFNEIWFGILVLKMIEISLITPPVGINVFVISGFFRDIPVERIFRTVFPFVLLDLVVVALLFQFPGIVTWALPS